MACSVVRGLAPLAAMTVLVARRRTREFQPPRTLRLAAVVDSANRIWRLMLNLMKMPRLWVGAVNSVLLKLAAFFRVS